MTEIAPARLRVAPSPTGDPHVGTAYMAIFNLAYARLTGGQFVLRIEDTDRARFQADSEQQVFDCLAWLGLDWDEGPDKGGPHAPYRQSERLDSYRPQAERLLARGQAYHCWCSPQRLKALRGEQERSKAAVTGYDRRCLGQTRDSLLAQGVDPAELVDQPVVRLLIPDDVELGFDDLVRGRVSAPRPDDQVILKADGFPTYHLAVVVDDHLMGITHVVRGEEWISSTPKHLLLYRLLGWTPPAFAHMPLLRNPDKSKISKRKNPAARLLWFKEQGYLPEALVNFLCLLAYPPVHQGDEVQTWDQFVAGFDWSKVNSTGPIVDLVKLDWLNGSYIRSLDPDELARRVTAQAQASGAWPVDPDPADQELLRRAVPLVQPRLASLNDALPQLDFLYRPDDQLPLDPGSVAALSDDADRLLAAAAAVLKVLPDWRHDAIQAALKAELVETLGVKPKFAFAPLRVAITGRRVSPPLFESMELLGRTACLNRIARFRAR
ncbi:MAG: glutamate--tRNA ligase [Propionibacteriaceae bacterium]|jgi:glutamyl-tRNA synthetase|nr:glutamate--tRNA ligase [Propionibacteriaceae bacterium]